MTGHIPSPIIFYFYLITLFFLSVVEHIFFSTCQIRRYKGMYSISTCQNRNCQRSEIQRRKRGNTFIRNTLYISNKLFQDFMPDETLTGCTESQSANKPHIWFCGIKIASRRIYVKYCRTRGFAEKRNLWISYTECKQVYICHQHDVVRKIAT